MKVSRIKLNNTTERFSRIVAGVWRWDNLSQEETSRLIHENLDYGITTFDHADIYGLYTCEALFGNVLKAEKELRDKMEIITKCGIKLVSPNRPDHSIHSYDTSKEHIINSVENSLKVLATDYIDVLLIHRPSPLMDMEEMAEAFQKLKTAGKVLHFGVSNFTPSQYETLNSFYPLVTNQVEISPLHLNSFLDGTLDQAQKLKFSPMAWSPFGGGRLFSNSESDEQIQRVRTVLDKLGKKYGNATYDQLALAFLLKHPTQVIPILGTTKAERISQAIKAEEITLSSDEWFEIWTSSTGEEVP